MFLHIGQEKSILMKDIIAIVDLKTRDNSQTTNEFLDIAKDEDFVVELTNKPNSFIVTTHKIYLSPISTVTLHKRIKTYLKHRD